MKKLLFAAMFLLISVASFGQGVIVNAPYTFNNTVKLGGVVTLGTVNTYSTGGQTPLVFNATTGKLEKTTVQYVQGKVIATAQTISIAKDTVLGNYLIKLTADRKDTIVFKTSLYTAGAAI